jgi:hypothetical protein
VKRKAKSQEESNDSVKKIADNHLVRHQWASILGITCFR